MTSYLSNIVMPYYCAQASKSDHFVLYDTNYEVLLASTPVLNRLGYNSQAEIEGKSVRDFGHIKHEMLTALEKLFNQVIVNQETISFIGIGGQTKPKYKNFHELIFQSFEPIIDDKGEVAAVLARKLPTINQNLIHLFVSNHKMDLTNSNKVAETFSSREFEIFYLLSNGYSQYEIATMLGITRGTVLRTISERIISKLGLLTNDSLAIIKMAICLGIHGKIPKTLAEEQLVIIPTHSDF